MNNSLHRLIDGMVATLRSEVIPNIGTEFARGQAFGVIYMLNSIRLRAEWSSAFHGELIAAPARLCAPALALKPHDCATIGTWLDRQHDRPIDRGAFHAASAQRLVERDRQIHADIVAVAAEEGVWADFDQHDAIAVVDFGGQYAHLIATKIRRQHVLSEIRQPEDDLREFSHYKGIILSGGPESVHAEDGPQAPPVVYELNVPVLGICYGMQTMADQLGGTVEASSHREFGHARVRALGESVLLDEIHDAVHADGYGMLDVWMSHGDHVSEMPPGFACIAATENAPIAAIAAGLGPMNVMPFFSRTRGNSSRSDKNP